MTLIHFSCFDSQESVSLEGGKAILFVLHSEVGKYFYIRYVILFCFTILVTLAAVLPTEILQVLQSLHIICAITSFLISLGPQSIILINISVLRQSHCFPFSTTLKL